MPLLLLFLQFSGAQTTAVLPDLKDKVKNSAAELHTGDPDLSEPVSFDAILVWSEDKSQLAIVMKVVLLDGWHMYAYVPETQPYITTEIHLNLPKGLTEIGRNKPASEPFGKGIYTYSGELVFVRYCTVEPAAKSGEITCGLYYQTCDVHKCFPPNTKTKTLDFSTF